jgi:hypothetical protein
VSFRILPVFPGRRCYYSIAGSVSVSRASTMDYLRDIGFLCKERQIGVPSITPIGSYRIALANHDRRQEFQTQPRACRCFSALTLWMPDQASPVSPFLFNRPSPFGCVKRSNNALRFLLCSSTLPYPLG